MTAAYEVISARALNPGAGGAAVTVNDGDSLTVKNFDNSQSAHLEGVWTEAATAGFAQIVSSKLHDTTRGVRFRTTAAARNLMPSGIKERLYPQDTLAVTLSGGGAETDTVGLLVAYSDLPGSSPRLATPEQVMSRRKAFKVLEVSCAGPATAGNWSAGTLINATEDLLHANADYAVMGYQVDTACCSVAIRGQETGNLRLGGPGPIEALETADWFVKLSRDLNMPAVPIINASNKGGTSVFVQDAAAGATIIVSLYLYELA
jgi:hypothetical protein